MMVPLVSRIRTGSALLLLLTLMLALVLPLQVQANVPTVAPGERIHFYADGFNPGERVDFWVTGPDGRSRPRFPAVFADDDGAVLWSWDVPTDAPGGRWTAVARGIRSNRQVPTDFIVVAPEAPTQVASVAPEAGAPGTTFRFAVTGLTPGDRFAPWVRGPDGRDRNIGPDSESLRVEVDREGRLAWTWTAPEGTLPGAWRSLARAERGGTVLEVPFTVTGQAPPAPVRQVQPVVGAPGTRFEVTVGGLTPGEVAGSWLNTPSGARVDGTPYMIVARDGTVQWTWTAPANAQAGRWQAITRGADSRIEVVLDLTITGANPEPAPRPDGDGSVTPASGKPFDTFTFTARGFNPNEQIAYWPTDPTGSSVPVLEKLRADHNGQVTWTWQTPRLVTTGTWIMTARGMTSRREVQIPFTIEAPYVPFATVTPDIGPPGTTFQFKAVGFNVHERLDTWVERPDGVVLHGTRDVKAIGDNSASWEWRAPDDAPEGTYIMVAVGRETDLTFRIEFRVRANP
ncbi:hypothetical protein EYB53_015050 [Candidatus Chloroploca sp. M-50]|uniref:Uncharacterized protein n=1 Tax=Candidatus Chloroploca mongolica TaxID=2528176 RepID=A0ABS4DC51_9CHLR|nr:hypothetical protein [Candidatus Chloroploca mongolica]MBP1467030.1 hypothetical protein [Candidatus Chloroploca mongolica]